jgi:hypothetical protein
MRYLTILLPLLLLSACASSHQAAPPAADAPSVSLLKSMLVGSFSSAAHAAADKDYRDIRLHMSPIWESRNDGPWLYVEQAVASDEAHPYRQRIYRLSMLGENTFQSEIFELAESPEGAQKFAGAWSNPTLLAGVSPETITPKQGCEVILKWFPTEHAFKGSTLAANCTSGFRGAAYATSQITLTDGLLTSWDRGYDAAGKQVWGAEKGGYRFIREP